MTKEDARQYIPHLEALADGELQFNQNTHENPKWKDSDEVSFSLPPSFYRRRPKPREVFVVLSGSIAVNAFDDEEQAKKYCVATNLTYFRAVEVLQ